ncbi:membrane protein [Mycobacteroides abscessus subsp. abscessus]|nr:membrane protein [Mycobacteroides abscessus subsp. abscessus]
MLRRWVTATVASLCLIVGCSPGEPIPPVSAFLNWPSALNDFRFRWTAEPGIDLTTAPAVVMRAYIESWDIGRLTRTPPAKLYPGFDQSVAAGDRDNQLRPEQTEEEWSKLPSTGPFFGNGYIHILEIDRTDNQYSAYICEGMYNVFYPAPDKTGKFHALPTSPFVRRVEFSKHGDYPRMAPQQGPLPAPVEDVFNGWQIDKISSVVNMADSLQFRCDGSMPHTRSQRKQISDALLDSPPKAEPAVPGWPNDSR